jgi:hypothetical protein
MATCNGRIYHFNVNNIQGFITTLPFCPYSYALKLFHHKPSIAVERKKLVSAKEVKNTANIATQAAKDYAQNQKEISTALQETKNEAMAKRNLWKEGDKSKLIQIGMALIVFPEPTPVSEIVGVGFLAAGAVQKGIKNQSTYIEDIPKSLKSALKDINSVRF